MSDLSSHRFKSRLKKLLSFWSKKISKDLFLGQVTTFGFENKTGFNNKNISSVKEKSKALIRLDSAEKFVAEITDALTNGGAAVSKRIEVERMADANKAFAHLRW